MIMALLVFCGSKAEAALGKAKVDGASGKRSVIYDVPYTG